MSTHSICFHGKIGEKKAWYPLLSREMRQTFNICTHLLQNSSESFSCLVEFWVHPDHSDEIQNLWNHCWYVLGFGIRKLIAGIFQYHEKFQVTFCLPWPFLKVQGPVVQSVVSLTSSLRVISLTVLADSIYNILIFFAEKMWVAFALQKLLTFFQQKISVYLCITRFKF